MASKLDPRPGRVPEQDLLNPRNLSAMTAELCIVFGKILRGVRVFPSGAIYRPKGVVRGSPRVRGGCWPRPPLDPRVGPTLPVGHPSAASDACKIIPDEKTLTPRRIFPNTIQSSAAIADKFRGLDYSCSGTLPGRGSTSGAIFIDIAASRDEGGVVTRRG